MDITCYKNETYDLCGIKLSRPCDLDSHLFIDHPDHFKKDLKGFGADPQGNLNTYPSEKDFKFIEGSYFDDYLSEYYLNTSDYNFKFPTDLISYKYDEITQILPMECRKKQYKLFLCINVIFENYDMKTDSMIYTNPPVLFRSCNHSVLHESMLSKIIDTATKKIRNRD